MALKIGDLSKVPPRQKVILAVLFCGLVVVGYYYLYYREASQRIGVMENHSAEIPSLLKSVSDLGKESGLEFLRFAPSGEAKKEFYAEIPVSISVHGDYHSFALFSHQAAKYPRIVNLSNISFSSPRPSGDNLVLLTVNCTATTYRFLEQQAAAAAPAAGGKGKKR